MIGELDSLIKDMSTSLEELGKLHEEIEKESGKKINMDNVVNEIKKEFDNTNLKENKITQQRYNARLAALKFKKDENQRIDDKINELQLKLNEKYDAFCKEFGRKISLRKENFEDFFVLSDEAKERRREQIKTLEDSINRDEENGVNPKAEYLVNRKKLLDNYKASLDTENREKDLDRFIELENIFKNAEKENIDTMISKLKVIIEGNNEKKDVSVEKESNKPLTKSEESINKNAEVINQKTDDSFENVPQKSIWTKLKGVFINGWNKFINIFSSIIQKGKKLLDSRQKKQLKNGDMDTHDMIEEMLGEINNKKSFKDSIKVNSEIKNSKDNSANRNNDSKEVKDEEVEKLIDEYYSI